MKKLQKVIKGSPSQADVLASNCAIIIETQGLIDALEYCKKQGEQPPQCSLTAQSANAKMLRVKAKRMLCETKWWERPLGYKVKQADFMKQLHAGEIYCEHDEHDH
jgi:hypothetical protein